MTTDTRHRIILVVCLWLVVLVAGVGIVAHATGGGSTPPPTPSTISVELRTDGTPEGNLWAWNRCQELGGTSMISLDPESLTLTCEGVPG